MKTIGFKVIKTYEEFQPGLLLPAHQDDDDDTYKVVLKLSDIYEWGRKDAEICAKKINSILSKGKYLKVKSMKSGKYFIKDNIPLYIIGVYEGNSFTLGNFESNRCKDDSIVIYSRLDEIVYIFSLEHGEFEFEFINSKQILTDQDPYGEEDWQEE